MSEPQPFAVRVDDDVLVDLRQRLQRTRWPQALSADWQYGTELGYLRSLCEYWRDGFDWRSQERKLNELEQFTLTVDGRRLHFVHRRSKHPDATPIVITHGWPGSFIEFTELVPRLTDPERHGGEARDAFHVVCPSIPGYTFSEAPREAGYAPRRIAAVVAELMQALGYERYLAQGGDWGSMITSWLGADHAAAVRGIHLNMAIAGPPPGQNPMEGVPPEELEAALRGQAFMRDETGYQRIQGTKPQTLGVGLNDSPAGLAAWIGEKFYGWSDNQGEPDSAIARDALLTNLTLYWVTGCITSSMRIYYEARKASADTLPARVAVPTAYAAFPHELYSPPRRWVEQIYDLRRYTRMPRGGHFAALEQPDLLAEDIRAFARIL